MNQTSKLFLSPILVFLLFCNFSWANDVCGDGAGYPDQYPFKNCGSVSTLTWDQANSCEELADNSSCAVAVAGGQGPYTWTISGTGFSFASGQTSIHTSENTVTVFTQDACGAGSITVTDGCGSVVDNAVRSVDGEWVVVVSPNSLEPCKITGDYSDLVSTSNTFKFEVIKGKYKLIQDTYTSFWGIDCQLPNGYQHCNDPGSIYAFDDNNPTHHSCIKNFVGTNELIHYEHDHCWWEQLESNGWQCKRTYWAEHTKYLYEWQCNL